MVFMREKHLCILIKMGKGWNCRETSHKLEKKQWPTGAHQQENEDWPCYKMYSNISSDFNKTVENLKKTLRHEENVHRALQRAINRPLGALPRLPPYLPQHAVELLAEVAVLEEEVVLLEEQVSNFRERLLREAAYVSSRKSVESPTTHSNSEMSIGSSNRGHSRSLSQSDVSFGSIQTRPWHSPSPCLSRVASIRKILFSEHGPERSKAVPREQGRIYSILSGSVDTDNFCKNSDIPVISSCQTPVKLNIDPNNCADQCKGHLRPRSLVFLDSPLPESPPLSNKHNFGGLGYGLGSENASSTDSCKDSKPNTGKKMSEIENTCKRRLSKPELASKSVNSPKMQCRIVEQAQETSWCSSDAKVVDADNEANKLSEDILNCLINIFVRLSPSKGRTVDFECFSSLASNVYSRNSEQESIFLDPYCNVIEPKKRDIGAYKYLYVVEAHSIDLKRKTNASFLIQRLKILLDKLSSVRLDGLSHQQKLAFWINIYNACIMNAYLDHGIPGGPEETVVQMQMAKINVGKCMINAVTIEHLILRLPSHVKYSRLKSAKEDGRSICRTICLEWPEPLVTFALSCGSWSSPAVRVYNASQVNAQLEAAKIDYLGAAVFTPSPGKIVITKLLDWYLLDFAKDLNSLLDWVCVQLPDDIRDGAGKCPDGEPPSSSVQVIPYNFGFRYLIHR